VKSPEHEPQAPHDEADSCSDGCCSETAPTTVPGNPKTRRVNPEVVEVHEGDALRGGTLKGLQRTVVRVEGMDCANCAATVEKRVHRLPGVHGATVNFAAGRLDAEHEGWPEPSRPRDHPSGVPSGHSPSSYPPFCSS
jgi:Zn2+/Cd2+-exporting ATPase